MNSRHAFSPELASNGGGMNVAAEYHVCVAFIVYCYVCRVSICEIHKLFINNSLVYVVQFPSTVILIRHNCHDSNTSRRYQVLRV